uniref:Spidroin-1-like n=1 Tax=Crassostrea virginica TaxID=6565 RepID=A0A8B8E1F7_CRAVI|nr:spidroin-1-like [Crassostrea virginica]WBW88632.1 polyalanine-containing protein A6 [Crassostrea virginica]
MALIKCVDTELPYRRTTFAKMIAAVSFLCFVAGSLAIPVPTDYYPKSGCGQYGCSNGHGAQGINGGLIGINSNGFESSMLGFDGGNSAAAAASAAASGLGSAAAAAAAAASGQQGIFGLNNGFNGEFGFNGGNSAAAASAAASGMNAAAAAAAAAAGSSGHGHYVGYQGTGQQYIGSYDGIIAPQGPYVQYQQQFGGIGGSAAASAAAAASQQGAAAAAAAAAGRNAAAAAAAAAGRNAAAAAAAAASGAGMGSQFGFGGLTGSQFNGQIGGHSGYFPGVPVFGQNSGASAAASAAASNNAAAAAAAAAASGSNGFINGGIIGGSSGIIGPQVLPGRKVY